MFDPRGLPAPLRSAADALGAARHASLRLGLASNCQPYSLRELEAVLAAAALSRDLFDPWLTFLSFEHGFSKPDPHVFQFLTIRLAARGISPVATLMVGDRCANDIAPAKNHGWRTWQFAADATGEGAGGWGVLRRRLRL